MTDANIDWSLWLEVEGGDTLVIPWFFTETSDDAIWLSSLYVVAVILARRACVPDAFIVPLVIRAGEAMANVTADASPLEEANFGIGVVGDALADALSKMR